MAIEEVTWPEWLGAGFVRRKSRIRLAAVELIRITDAGGEVVIDVDYAPLYLTYWRGNLSMELIARLFEFSNEVGQTALESMTRLAYVNHVDDVQRPDAQVRRLVTELSVEHERSGRKAPTVGSWQIISNPMIRGVLTALRWVSSDLVDGRTASSWDDGITRAVAALTDAGQQVPTIDPSSYEFPHQRLPHASGDR